MGLYLFDDRRWQISRTSRSSNAREKGGPKVQFLCIIPKFERTALIEETQIYITVQALVRSVEMSYSDYRGEGYKAPRIVKASANATAFIAIWDRQGESGDGSYCSAGDRWVASSGHKVAQSIHRDVVLAGGRLRYVDPVWGSYAVVVGERYTDRITAWNTAPALESIHYGENTDYVFISNRPILAALARAHGNTNNLDLSDDYLSEYLAFGYSVSGQTPFLGIHTSPVDSAVSVVKGRLHLEPAPGGLNSTLAPDHTQDEGAEALAQALTSAMDRTQDDISGSNLQIRLSGGKDSRLILGLVRGREINAHAITYGVESDAEVAIAAKVAAMANVPHRFGTPLLSAGTSTSEQTLSTILECGGIPPSEPHLVINAGSAPDKINDAIMLGQWPLFKGGMAKVVRYPQGGIEKTLRGQIASMVGQDVRSHHEDALWSWSNNVHASSELEKLYLFARQFRSGRYLHSHISHYARDAKIAYPISDAEVTAVSDILTMYEKISQKSLFLAMREIWPESLSIPLHGSTWRFEVGGPTDISGPDYSARQEKREGYAPEKDYRRDGSAPSAYDSSMIDALCREIVSSPRWDKLSPMLTKTMYQSITSSAQELEGWQFTEQAYTTKEFAKYVWRVYVADKWLSRDWMPRT